MSEIITTQRSNQRIECSNSCYLRFNDSEYRCVIENLSNSGALLKLETDQPLDLQQGSQCSLIISDDPQFVPGEFIGRIVHQDAPKIGIEFQF